MEKIVFACLGAYLEPSGIFSVLVETELFGPDTISSVMISSGSHYSRSRTAHSIIHEVLLSMMIKAFLIKHPEKRIQLHELSVDFHSEKFTNEVWNTKKEQAEAVEEAFLAYVREMASQSQSFAFWTTYVFDLYPIDLYSIAIFTRRVFPLKILYYEHYYSVIQSPRLPFKDTIL